MPKLNSVITIITHLKGVVYFFVFFALLSSTRLFKSLSPSSESWDKGEVIPISKAFYCFDFSQLLFLCFKFNVFVFIILFMFLITTNKMHLKKKIESNEKKKTLQNLAGGKYFYDLSNFIYVCRKDVKCATTPSKCFVILL